VRVEITASEPLDPAGIVDGRRVALCREDDAAAVKRAASEPAGIEPGSPVLAARASLEDGARKAVLVPLAPLSAGGRFAVVVGPGLRAADGRTVLDADGRARAAVATFDVAAGSGEPVNAAITEVLSDAATPEAGGEYVEVENLSERPVDLGGFRLAKRGTSETFTRCTVAPRTGGPVQAGGRAIVVGGAWDGRYPLPPGTPVYQCGATALLGGLANDRAPAIRLEDPAGAVVSSIGVDEPAPRCAGGALERLDPAGPDAASNLGCSENPSPGA
jgi:hypothetical protein